MMMVMMSMYVDDDVHAAYKEMLSGSSPTRLDHPKPNSVSLYASRAHGVPDWAVRDPAQDSDLGP